MPQRRGESNNLRSSGQQPPNLPWHVCPYQRSHQNLRNDASIPSIPVCESTPWLAQDKCQVTYLRTEIGLLLPNYLDSGKKETRQKMNLKLQPMSQVPNLRLKEEEESRQVNSPQKMQLGTRLSLLQISRTEGKSKARCSHKSYHLKQSSKLQDQKH